LIPVRAEGADAVKNVDPKYVIWGLIIILALIFLGWAVNSATT
jgi:hypothetical protein